MKQQTRVGGSLAAMKELADQNIIPSLFGVEGEWKAMYSVVMIEPDGMAALMRAPDQIVPLIDIYNSGDKFTTFELYVRNFGPGTRMAQHWLKYIRDWDQAGRPNTSKWHIRGILGETEYQPTAGEFLVNKPWTKLIISYQ